MAGVASDGEFWVAKVLRTVEQLRKDVKHVEFIQELDESEQELTDKAGAVAEKLHKASLHIDSTCSLNFAHFPMIGYGGEARSCEGCRAFAPVLSLAILCIQRR